MSTDPSELDLLPLPVVAERLHLPITKVHQLINDGLVVAIRMDGGPASIPAAFLDGDGPVKGLSGVITLLRDARYTDAEIVEWLFRSDDSIPGTPVAALQANRGTEIKRRAQATGF